MAEFRRYGSSTGRAVVEFEAEVNVSGAKAERPILDEILRRIELPKGHPDRLGGILIYRLNRLSRLKPRERLELVERIDAAGGEIVSCTENLDRSTPEGRFTFEMFMSLARMEWERYAEGWATAKVAALDEGIAIQSHIPFGYRRGELRLVYRRAAAPLEQHEAELVEQPTA